jgi:hypothetical protein
MEMTTRISKGRDGWEANTQMDMQEANRVLIVTTRKMTGGMVTRAMVNTDSGSGFLSWNLFGDFSTRTQYKGVRCTEKTVRDLHQQALAAIEQTLAAARAHYQAKQVQEAA